MRKIIFWLLFIVLLLWAGFTFIIQNPDLPVSKSILTTIGITTTTPIVQDLTGQTSTGIDLTDCVSYFDGCNHCSVKDGKPDACTLMYCETPSTPKCLQYATGNEAIVTQATGAAGIANPASVYCQNNWGTLEIQTDTSGWQIGLCHLLDGTTCDERAYLRGECKPDKWNTVCTAEYAPVCASIQIQCIRAPCNPIEQTFSNTCTMDANKLAVFLHDGECVAK